jgi:DNA-directed RNA polymerase specialized sigma24 family protein
MAHEARRAGWAREAREGASAAPAEARADAGGAGADGPAVGGDFELTPEVVAALDELARAARDDPAARNDLYAALALKIARFLAPYRRRTRRASGAALDFAEVEQEAFLVFAGLLGEWDGVGSFARYFLVFFPWRLSHAVRAYERRWPCRRLVALRDESGGSERSHPGPAGPAGVEQEAELAAQVGPLSAEERWLLRLRIEDDWRLEEVALLFGWSRRTTFRRWRALLDRLERELGEAAPATRSAS